MTTAMYRKKVYLRLTVPEGSEPITVTVGKQGSRAAGRYGDWRNKLAHLKQEVDSTHNIRV